MGLEFVYKLNSSYYDTTFAVTVSQQNGIRCLYGNINLLAF